MTRQQREAALDYQRKLAKVESLQPYGPSYALTKACALLDRAETAVLRATPENESPIFDIPRNEDQP